MAYFKQANRARSEVGGFSLAAIPHFCHLFLFRLCSDFLCQDLHVDAGTKRGPSSCPIQSRSNLSRRSYVLQSQDPPLAISVVNDRRSTNPRTLIIVKKASLTAHAAVLLVRPSCLALCCCCCCCCSASSCPRMQYCSLCSTQPSQARARARIARVAEFPCPWPRDMSCHSQETAL